MEWEPLYASPSSGHGSDCTSAPASSSHSPSSSSCSDSAAEDTIGQKAHAFVCTFPGCTRRFRRKFTLKDHLNAHRGQQPFMCPVSSCGRRFTTSGNLARHRRCLHPWLGGPLPCLVDGCECEFPTNEKLQRHMLSHFDDSGAYRCDIGMCGRVFTSTGNLRRHVKQNHDHTPEAERLKLTMRPRRRSPVRKAARTQEAESNRVLPPPLSFPARADHQLPSDDELLDVLLCLFDEENDQD